MKTLQDVIVEIGAVQSALAIAQADLQAIMEAQPAPTPIVTPEDVEIDVVLSDGTTKKFVPAVTA